MFVYVLLHICSKAVKCICGDKKAAGLAVSFHLSFYGIVQNAGKYAYGLLSGRETVALS